MWGRSNYLPYFTLKWLLLHTLVVRRALRQSSNLQGLSREGRDREKARSVFLCCSSSDIFSGTPRRALFSRPVFYLLRSNTFCLREFWKPSWYPHENWIRWRAFTNSWKCSFWQNAFPDSWKSKFIKKLCRKTLQFSIPFPSTKGTEKRIMFTSWCFKRSFITQTLFLPSRLANPCIWIHRCINPDKFRILFRCWQCPLNGTFHLLVDTLEALQNLLGTHPHHNPHKTCQYCKHFACKIQRL